uniref:CCR4-NOT transcription complex subunit 4 n=1 Tax=Corethrella appendiculata TaxID=1370023 RepID=U5EUH9_9DIPT
MNVMNHSSDEQVECPLCMEPLEVDDLNFYPCTCGYQICRFCWHRIRTDENELCPACRKAYPENPADFKPLSQEQIAAFKAEKRQRDQQRKAKISENRKHLANVRVVQKNLVFVVGLPPRLAEAEILKKHEYFGKYGKIHKVVINPSTTYAGVQGPSASAYVTYVNNSDALRAIQSVNNIMIDGRLIKTSLGTTKYCSHFMKNQTCPKPDCMYLHDLGDSEASFTKEEMHQGKHQEYEKRLHEIQQAQALQQPQTNGVTTPPVTQTNGLITNGTTKGDKLSSDITNGPIQNNKEAWPSLSTSPVNNKENKLNGGNINKELSNRKHDKIKSEKIKGNNKGKHGSHNGNSNSIKDSSTTDNNHNSGSKNINHKHLNHHVINNDLDDDDDLDEFDEETDGLSSDNDGNKTDTPSISSTSNSGDSGTVSETASGKSSPASAFPDPPSLNTSSNSQTNLQLPNTTNSNNLQQQHQQTNVINSVNNSTNQSTTLSTSTTLNISDDSDLHSMTTASTASLNGFISTSLFNNSNSNNESTTKLNNNMNGIKLNKLGDTTSRFSKISLFDDNSSFFSHNTFQPYYKLDAGMNGNSENNQQTNSQLPDLLNGTNELHNNSNLNTKELLKNLGNLQHQQQQHQHLQNSLANSQHLQHINGLGLSDNTSALPLTDDWEAAFKYMLRNNSNKQQSDEHEELLRMQELQKRNNLINAGISLPQFNGFNGDYNSEYFHNANDINSRLSQTALLQNQQQQQLRLNNIHTDLNHIYSNNMSKFFDFHKNQQQQQNTQPQPPFMMNGHTNQPSADQINMANILESNRLNSHYLDQHTNGLLGSQLHQKQRLLNGQLNAHNLLLNNQQQQQQQQQQPPNGRIHNPQQYAQNPVLDDDLGNILGFDPFFETQKGLAELLNDEIIQQQTQVNQNKLLDNCQRTRMPPPGFNHMNAFGFGVPRAQGSKILPFMNNTQQQTQPPHNNWGQPLQQQQQPPQHMGFPPQQNLNDPTHPTQQSQPQNGHNKAGFGNNFTDWTSFDPAIVSFRQFSSFMNGPAQQQQQQQQQNNNDMFMQSQLNQPPNVQPQPGQGFGHHGMLQNSIMNQQQQTNPQAQVNFSHSNWLNTDQNIYMHNLTNNGFTNNFEKFTISMPPGFQNNVTGNSKQKAECIN